MEIGLETERQIVREIEDFYGAHYDPVAKKFLEMDDRGVLTDEDDNANHAARGARIALEQSAPRPVLDREAVKAAVRKVIFNEFGTYVGAVDRITNSVLELSAELNREPVDKALRKVIEFADYDLHKALEHDEETGEDTYSEHVDRFIAEYDKASGAAGSES